MFTNNPLLDITNDSTEKKFLTEKKYYEHLYANRLDDFDEMCHGRHKLPKVSEEEIENLNRLVTNEEIEVTIEKSPIKKSPGSDGFPGEFISCVRKK